MFYFVWQISHSINTFCKCIFTLHIRRQMPVSNLRFMNLAQKLELIEGRLRPYILVM